MNSRTSLALCATFVRSLARYGPSPDGALALRKGGSLDERSKAKVVKDTRGVLQCTYYREGVVLGESPVSMIIR